MLDSHLHLLLLAYLLVQGLLVAVSQVSVLEHVQLEVLVEYIQVTEGGVLVSHRLLPYLL